MTIAPELRDRIVPLAAGWYAAEHPWDSCYGTPLRLGSDARRFDVSPAWLSWHAAAATLELFKPSGSDGSTSITWRWPTGSEQASGSSRAIRRSCRSTPLTRRPSGWQAPE